MKTSIVRGVEPIELKSSLFSTTLFFIKQNGSKLQVFICALKKIKKKINEASNLDTIK